MLCFFVSLIRLPRALAERIYARICVSRWWGLRRRGNSLTWSKAAAAGGLQGRMTSSEEWQRRASVPKSSPQN